VAFAGHFSELPYPLSMRQAAASFDLSYWCSSRFLYGGVSESASLLFCSQSRSVSGAGGLLGSEVGARSRASVSASVLSRACSSMPVLALRCRYLVCNPRWFMCHAGRLATDACVWAEVVAWLRRRFELLPSGRVDRVANSWLGSDRKWWSLVANRGGSPVHLGLLFACASFELCDETWFRWRTLTL
jgi:hypothetical protein